MYHEFKQAQDQDKRVNEKVSKTITFYQNHVLYGPQQSILDLEYTRSIKIQMTVNNLKDGVKLFVLSNGKVLRYEYTQNEILQVEGLQDMGILQIKVLEMGNRQRYVIMTQDGVSVCTIRDSQCKQNQNEQQAKYEQQHQQKFIIQTIPCDLIGSMFINFNNKNLHNINNNQQQQQQQQQDLPSASISRHRQMFIIKINNNGQNNSKNIHNQQNNVVNEGVIVVVVNQAGWGMWYQLMAYYIEVKSQSHNVDNGNNNNNNNTLQQQHCLIYPLKLPNNNYSMPLILSDTDIYSLKAQNQHIDQIQLKDLNFKYSRTHPIIKVDSFININNNTFSIYFATQCVTDMFEPQDYRHRVFQFMIKVNVVQQCQQKQFNKQQLQMNKTNKQKIVAEEQSQNHQLQEQLSMSEKIHSQFLTNKIYILSSITTTYEFTQTQNNNNNSHKKVIYPYRVYMLPLLLHQSAILLYFQVTKTINHKRGQQIPHQFSSSNVLVNLSHLQGQQDIQEHTLQQEVIKLSGVVIQQQQQQQSNKISFISTNIKVKSKTNNNHLHPHQFKYHINEQNLSLNTRISSSSLIFPNKSKPSECTITLRQVLLFDCVKNYAILLVNKSWLKILLNEQQQNQQQQQNNKLFIIIVNLLQHQQNRLVSCYQLQSEFNDSICGQLSITAIKPTINNNKIISINNNNIPQSIYTQTKNQNQINLHKQINIINSKTTKNVITKTLTLVPKLAIYQQLLQHVININKKDQNYDKYESQIKIYSQSNVNYQSFISNVLKLLAI